MAASASSNLGLANGQTGLDTGYNDVNVGAVACTAGFNGCYGQTGCGGGASNDSVYSVVWDDDVNGGYNIVAIGDSNYSAFNQPVLWGLSKIGQADTAFGGVSGGDGLGVANVDLDAFSTVTGAAATEVSSVDGDIYLASTFRGYCSDLFVARYGVPSTDSGASSYGLDPYFGTDPSGQPGHGIGYFEQDLGSATSTSTDNGVGIAEELDGSMDLLGSTNSPGGSTAVIRYNINSAIFVNASEPSRTMSIAAVQAASQPTATFSTTPTITSDTTVSDLSPPDASGGQDPLQRRSARRRPGVALGAPPKVTTVSSP